jgi:hypothetical protein
MAILSLGKLPDGFTVVNPNAHRLAGGTVILGDYFYNPEYKIVDEKIYSATGQLWPTGLIHTY